MALTAAPAALLPWKFAADCVAASRDLGFTGFWGTIRLAAAQIGAQRLFQPLLPVVCLFLAMLGCLGVHRFRCAWRCLRLHLAGPFAACKQHRRVAKATRFSSLQFAAVAQG